MYTFLHILINYIKLEIKIFNSLHFLKVRLYKDFGYDDDTVITTLERSIEELKKAKLDHPGPPTNDELPRRTLGQFIEPTFERKIGRRAEEFSEVEKITNETVVLTREKTAREVAECRESHISVGDGPELAGTDTDSDSSYENECTKL